MDLIEDEKRHGRYFLKEITSKKRVAETFRLLRKGVIYRAIFEVSDYFRNVVITGSIRSGFAIVHEPCGRLTITQVAFEGKKVWMGIFNGEDLGMTDQIEAETAAFALLGAKEMLWRSIKRDELRKGACLPLINEINYIIDGDILNEWPLFAEICP
jgi:hypothetical protein